MKKKMVRSESMRLRELVYFSEKLDGHRLAVVESSLFNESGYTPIGSRKPIYYFSRIKVDDKYCGRGIGSRLLDTMLNYMKENNCALICDINPYGCMSYNDLENWYIRHGMKYYDNVLWFNA